MILALIAACADPATSPLARIDRDVDHAPFVARVDERIDAGGYSYLRLGEEWVVGLDHGLQVGEDARVLRIGRARDFRSARTGRAFEALTFAVVVRP